MVRDPTTAHDALFKQVFSNTESARRLLQAVLPPELLQRLSLPTLTLSPGSYVDESLASSHSDLLFSVELAGRPALLYVLFEHKSKDHPLTALQLLGYQLRIWKDFVKERGDGKQALPLPVVIPLVFHHSEEGWTTSTRFEDLFERELVETPELAGLVPRFRFVLDDISRLSDEALRARALGLLPTLALWVLRDARNSARLVASIRHWVSAVAELARAPSGREALGTIFRYLSLVADQSAVKVLLTTLHTESPQGEEALMTTLAEEWMAQGRAQMEAAVRAAETKAKAAETKAKGAAVLAVLEARGLALSPEQRARVEACTDPALLDRWLRAAATAPEASEVFGS